MIILNRCLPSFLLHTTYGGSYTLMLEFLVSLFKEWGWLAIPISLVINTIINIIGFIPSLFITTANVIVWGPWLGGLLSWCGEMLGSIIAFIGLKKGLHKKNIHKHEQWKWVQKINSFSPNQQFLSILVARLMPLIPTGAVNLTAAITQVSLFTFFLATAIGKIPSLALEVLISFDIIHIQENWFRLTITLVLITVSYFLFRSKEKKDFPHN